MPLASELENPAGCLRSQLRKARRFHLDNLPPHPAPLAVVGGGHEFCPPEQALQRESPHCYSIEFVARGRGWLTLDGIGHRLGAGAVFSYGPDLRPRIAADPGDVLEKYFVDFTGPRAPQVLNAYGLAPATVARVSSVSEVQDIFDSLIRDGLRGTGASGMLCAALWEYLIIKLGNLVVPPGTRPSSAAVTFQRCRQYITTHFRRLRSLEQIAQECGIDHAYLCRLFRRFDRQTPYQCLLRLKMNFAAEQLRDPKMRVKQVAASLGFEDPFHFSHAFKNVLGTSPDLFRRLRDA